MATDQTFIIRGTLIEPDGTALASAKVEVYRLGGPQVAADLVDSTQYTADYFSGTTDANGVYSITVTHALASSGPLAYKVVLPDNKYYMQYFGVNDGSRTFDAGTISIESNPPKKGEINITPLVQKNMAEGHAGSNVVQPAASTVQVIDTAVGNIHSTKVILTDVPVSNTNAGSGISFGGTQILDFPAGQIYVLAAWNEGPTVDGSAVTNDSANVIDGSANGDMSYGTAVATAALASTMVDIVPKFDVEFDNAAVAFARLAAAATFDGTATAKDVFVNMNIDDADVGASPTDVVLVSDVLHIVWVYGGDD